MYTNEEQKLVMVLVYEEYEKNSLNRTDKKYARGNKQDRLIEIQAEIQRTQDILEKLDNLDPV